MRIDGQYFSIVVTKIWDLYNNEFRGVDVLIETNNEQESGALRDTSVGCNNEDIAAIITENEINALIADLELMLQYAKTGLSKKGKKS